VKKEGQFRYYTVSYMVDKVRERSLQVLHYNLHSGQSMMNEGHFRYYNENYIVDKVHR